MKVEYGILTLAVSLVYAIVLIFLPDLPVGESVFQILIGYLLLKLGVEVVGKPSDALRARFAPNVKAKKK